MALNHTGTQTLETARLRLRRFRLSDAQSMFDNWASDPAVTKYLTWQAHDNIGLTKTILSEWVAKYESVDNYHWAICLKENDMPIGGTDLRVNETARRCEVGYCLSKAYWGKGLMTEALRALIAFGFDTVGFERIESYHHVENPASGRVMQKAGMRHEGTLRRYGLTNTGELVDCDFYAIVKDDPRP